MSSFKRGLDWTLLSLQRVPRAVSGACVLTGLVTSATIGEVIERESPSAANRHERLKKCKAISPAQFDQLHAQGYLVVDGFLPEPVLDAARSDCVSAASSFQRTDQHAAAVRSDSIYWMNEGDTSNRPGLLTVLRAVRGLASQLDTDHQRRRERELLDDVHGGARLIELGVPRGAQVAKYTAPTEDDVVNSTGGARYTAHRDGIAWGLGSVAQAVLMPGICMREVTAIVYLTAAVGGWPSAEHAGRSGSIEAAGEAPRVVGDVATLRPGALVLYIGAADDDVIGVTATSVVEIMPVGGRVVLFDSRSILHEVRPHTRRDVDRLAMTIWIGGAHDAGGLWRHLRAWWGPAPRARGVPRETL